MQAITNKFQKLGGEAGVLGGPKGVKQLSADGIGSFRLFENGAIYWHPKCGAFAVQGVIYKEWVKTGSERGALGYPVSDQKVSGDGLSRCSCFEKGRIYQQADKVWTTDLFSDAAEVAWGAFQAKPLPADWLDQYKDFGKLPASIDYQADANFLRNQGTIGGGLLGGSGCPTYALLHILDILKDWEHPYTPALSFHFANWLHEVYLAQYDRKATLQEQAAYGYASEALCPTNWDTQWNPTDLWDEPSQIAKDEVAFYRARMLAEADYHQCSEENSEQSLKAIKQALRAYGPLWCGGNGHAKAIIGYDDDTQKFKIIDSYPHEGAYGGHNIRDFSYQDVGPGKDIAYFAEVINIPNNTRLTGRYAYTARIAVDSDIPDNNWQEYGTWRGTYNVRIGVEGREPLEVWTTRGRDVNPETALEDSRFLRIDVPLPEYAAECWPPSAKHRWFLEVEDCDRDGRQGTITEFTLARCYVHPNCKSVGKYRTQTYGGTMSVVVPDPSSGPIVPARFKAGWPPKTPNANPGTVCVHIPEESSGPTVGVSTAVLKLSLTLPSSQIVIDGNQVTLKGKFKNVALNTPMAGKKVRLCRLQPNACVNKPAVWQKVREVQTNSSGDFSFQMTLTEYKVHMYAAAYYAGDEVLASSAPHVLVYEKVIKNRKQINRCVLVEKKDWAKTLPKILPVDVRELIQRRGVKIPHI